MSNSLTDAMSKKIISQQRASLRLRDEEILRLHEENLQLRRAITKLTCLIAELHDLTTDTDNNCRQIVDKLP